METSQKLIRAIKELVAQGYLLLFKKDWKKLGLQVWMQLDSELPQAIGALLNDRPRVNLFAQRVRKLSWVKQYALRKWLRRELYELEHNFAEFTSMQLEEYEQRTKQIYRQHLEVLS